MFRRLDKFDEIIYGWERGAEGGWGDIRGWLIFGMLIGLHIWEERIFGGGGAFIWGSIKGILQYLYKRP